MNRREPLPRRNILAEVSRQATVAFGFALDPPATRLLRPSDFIIARSRIRRAIFCLRTR